MPNEQTGKSTLGALRLQYLGGDDDWYSGASDTISSPITISGAFASILKFANENSLSIVPEAQNMTKYDGSGIATVTLSASGGGSDFVGVTGTATFINNTQSNMPISMSAVNMETIGDNAYPTPFMGDAGVDPNGTLTLTFGVDYGYPLLVGSILDLHSLNNTTYSDITNLEQVSEFGQYKVLGEFTITLTQNS